MLEQIACCPHEVDFTFSCPLAATQPFIGTLLKLPERGLTPGGVTGPFLFVYPELRALVNFTRFSNRPVPWADQVVSLSFAAAGLAILLLSWFSRVLIKGVGTAGRCEKMKVNSHVLPVHFPAPSGCIERDTASQGFAAPC